MAQSTYSLANDKSGYVSVGSPAELTNLAAFTLSCWLKLDSFSIIGYLLAKFPGWALGVDGTFTGSHKLISFDGSTVLTASTALITGVWYHVALTWNGTTATLYLDGSSDGSGSQSYPSDSGNAFVIGTRSDNLGNTGLGTGGLIDDVAVFDSVLSGGTIAGIAAGSTNVATLSPVGLWRLEEGAGTTAADSSGNGNDGTLSGGVSWSSDVPAALTGGSFVDNTTPVLMSLMGGF